MVHGSSFNFQGTLVGRSGEDSRLVKKLGNK